MEEEKRHRTAQTFQVRDKSPVQRTDKFKNGTPLRNLDVTIEDSQSARKIRRIVEKRMCQAYFRQHSEDFRQNGNMDRHLMSRATSFQLFNIGQIDDIKYQKREHSSHWKKKYDPVTGKMNVQYSNDGLHLLGNGYLRWAEIVKPYVLK